MTNKMILKNQQDFSIVNDDWHIVRHAVRKDLDGDGGCEPLVIPKGKVMIPLKDWLKRADEICQSRPKDELGVWIAPGEDVMLLKDQLSKIGVIGIDFPVFRDGRGFSSSYLLRERLGWTGQIRAIGNVLRDQMLYMLRVGFDAFAVDPTKDAQDALNAFNELKVRYQGDYLESNPLYRRAKRPDASEWMSQAK